MRIFIHNAETGKIINNFTSNSPLTDLDYYRDRSKDGESFDVFVSKQGSLPRRVFYIANNKITSIEVK